MTRPIEVIEAELRAAREAEARKNLETDMAKLQEELEQYKKIKKKRPMSKTLVRWTPYKEWFIILVTIGMCVYKGDLTPMAYLIPAVFVEIGVEKAFYFKNSEAEKVAAMQYGYDPDYNSKNFKEG